MKRVSKTNLSLAIALTIASSVGQYAMAGSTLVTSPTGAHITANNGGKFTAGAMTNKVSTIEALRQFFTETSKIIRDFLCI